MVCLLLMYEGVACLRHKTHTDNEKDLANYQQNRQITNANFPKCGVGKDQSLNNKFDNIRMSDIQNFEQVLAYL